MSDARASLSGRLDAVREAMSGLSFQRSALVIAAVIAGLVFLGTLRQAAPPRDTPKPASTFGATVRFTPSPTTPPRGDLPRAAVVDTTHNRVIGHIPLTGAAPGETTVRFEVDKILDWYCPDATGRDISIRQLRGWNKVEVTTHPRPGFDLVLSMLWTGSSYRWQGPYDRLEECW